MIHSFDDENKYSLYLGDVSAALDIDFIHKSNIKTGIFCLIHLVVTAAAAMDQVVYKPEDDIKHIVYPVLDHKN